MSEYNFTLEKKWIETTVGKIYYYLDNAFPGRPTIVYLHGLSSNHTTWLKTVVSMRTQRYNSLLVELRGHGHSDKTRRKRLYRMPVFSRDLAAILETESLDKIILVGYSYGGVVALDYAVGHPRTLTGLILISTNHKNPLHYWRLDFLSPFGRAIVNALALLLIWQKRKQYYYYRPQRSRGYWHSVLEGFATMPWSINLWMLEQMALIDYSADLVRIDAPTLLVYSRGDPFVTKAEVDDMLNKLPHADMAVSVNDNHFIASQSQDEIVRIILNFLHQYENSHL